MAIYKYILCVATYSQFISVFSYCSLFFVDFLFSTFLFIYTLCLQCAHCTNGSIRQSKQISNENNSKSIFWMLLHYALCNLLNFRLQSVDNVCVLLFFLLPLTFLTRLASDWTTIDWLNFYWSIQCNSLGSIPKVFTIPNNKRKKKEPSDDSLTNTHQSLKLRAFIFDSYVFHSLAYKYRVHFVLFFAPNCRAHRNQI